MDAREMRGMEIAATKKLRRTSEGWIVPSSTGQRNYTVAPLVPLRRPGPGQTIPEWICSCPDWELRGQDCKHVFAVTYVMRREVAPDGTVVEETRVTYAQAWSSYNAAQCAEKDTFLPMLADLCSTIPSPPQGRGRPRMPMSDMAYNCVLKVYEGLSARRLDSDVRESHAKGLTDVDPHFTTVLRYLRSPEMTPVLRELVELSALPMRAVEQDFAVDSTGFTTCRFERWYDHKWGKERSQHKWVKLHAMTGVRTNVVTAVEITDGHSGDSPQFLPTLATTARNFPIREVSADKAYWAKKNMAAVDDLGGTPYIPVRGPVYAVQGVMPDIPSGTSAFLRMQYLFAYQRDTFLSHYHKRSNVETTFSMIKRKFGDSLRSKSEVGQTNEILCKVICHNLCVVIASIYELGLEVPPFATVRQAPALVAG